MNYTRWKATQWGAWSSIHFLNVIWILVSETQDLSTDLMENVALQPHDRVKETLAIKQWEWENEEKKVVP